VVAHSPNDWQISCRLSCWRPHQSTLPLFGLKGGDARAERRPTRPVGCICGLGGNLVRSKYMGNT